MSKKASKTPMQKWTGTNSRIQQLEAQVKDLESQLYKAQLMATGTGPGVQAIIDEADRQRQIMQAKIEEMQEIINRFSVFGLTSGDVEQAFTPEQLEAWRNMPVRTAVKCVAAFRDTRDDNNILSYEYAGYYPGTPKEAKADIGPRIAALLRRAPTPEEIRRKGLMGLSDETMQTALNALAPHYWTKDRSAFAVERNRVFDDLVWPEIEKHYSHDQREARNRFRKEIDASFKKHRLRG